MLGSVKKGDIVRYKGCKTEYEIVRVRTATIVDLKLIKLDVDKIYHAHPLGSIFPWNQVAKLEILKKVPRHPLTSIFK